MRKLHGACRILAITVAVASAAGASLLTPAAIAASCCGACTAHAPLPRFPVKWTPPEGFTGKFSSASDVWSFGILCVEIFQDGLSPYVGMSMPAVMHKVTTGT